MRKYKICKRINYTTILHVYTAYLKKEGNPIFGHYFIISFGGRGKGDASMIWYDTR